jgi:DNA polymerase-3 subunit delta
VAKKPESNTPLSADHRIVVLIGKEPFLQGEYTAQVRELLEKKFGEVDKVGFDAETSGTTLAAVLDECRTFGLMVTHKLVVVDHAEDLIKEDNRPLMERYAAAPCDAATLLLRCDQWHKGKLDALIESVGVLKTLKQPTAADAALWAVRRCAKRYEGDLKPDAAQLLIERIGPNLGLLDGELAKLAAYVGPGKPITRAAVTDLVGRSSDEEAWVIQSVLIAGNPAASLAKLRELSELSREPVQKTLWATVDLARKLHGAARGLRAGENPWSLAGKLRLWGDSKEPILAAAKRLDPTKAAALFKEAVTADRKSKTGQTDPERALEALAIRFAQALA